MPCIGCTAAGTPRSQDGPATLELRRLVAANPELKRLLIASIERAKQINPVPLTKPAQSIEPYFDGFQERPLGKFTDFCNLDLDRCRRQFLKRLD
jgi:hypothetical protein